MCPDKWYEQSLNKGLTKVFYCQADSLSLYLTQVGWGNPNIRLGVCQMAAFLT